MIPFLQNVNTFSFNSHSVFDNHINCDAFSIWTCQIDSVKLNHGHSVYLSERMIKSFLHCNFNVILWFSSTKSYWNTRAQDILWRPLLISFVSFHIVFGCFVYQAKIKWRLVFFMEYLSWSNMGYFIWKNYEKQQRNVYIDMLMLAYQKRKKKTQKKRHSRFFMQTKRKIDRMI